MQIVGRRFTHAGFKAYLGGLTITPWAKFVVVHNTSAPDIALYRQWLQRPGWTPEQWMKNLVSYYASMHPPWNGTPHLFIPPTPDTILVLNSLLARGTHTPSWNGFSYGVETVGEFQHETFEDPTRANLVAALAMLHTKLGLDPTDYQLGVRGLHYHKEDRNTTHKQCPGKNMIKADLVEAVADAMHVPHAPHGEPGPPVPQLGGHLDVPVNAQEIDTSHMTIEELTSMKWVQIRLNRWNPKLGLTVDGVLGTKGAHTRTAVTAFQTEHHLTADGIPGPVTRSVLKQATDK